MAQGNALSRFSDAGYTGFLTGESSHDLPYLLGIARKKGHVLWSAPEAAAFACTHPGTLRNDFKDILGTRTAAVCFKDRRGGYSVAFDDMPGQENVVFARMAEYFGSNPNSPDGRCLLPAGETAVRELIERAESSGRVFEMNSENIHDGLHFSRIGDEDAGGSPAFVRDKFIEAVLGDVSGPLAGALSKIYGIVASFVPTSAHLREIGVTGDNAQVYLVGVGGAKNVFASGRNTGVQFIRANMGFNEHFDGRAVKNPVEYSPGKRERRLMSMEGY